MLSVRDNGVGLSPEMLENGFGLRGLQERAQQVGGSLQIDKGVGGWCAGVVCGPD